MKKMIRSTNDLFLSVLMGAIAIFLLVNKKIITGVENGLGGHWAQASTYIHLVAGILLGLAVLQLIYAINFKRDESAFSKINIPVSKEIVITAVTLVLYALLLPILTFFPCTLALIIVLCGTFAMKENEGTEQGKKLNKKQLITILIYSAVLTVVLWVLFSQILNCVLP